MMKIEKLKQYLLSGVSYAIPFVACGGILIAFAIAFAPMTAQGPDFSGSPFLKLILDIGTTAFSLLGCLFGLSRSESPSIKMVLKRGEK